MPRVCGTCWTGTSRVRTSPCKTTSSRKASSQANTSDRAHHRPELYPFLSSGENCEEKLLFHRCMCRSSHGDLSATGNKQDMPLLALHRGNKLDFVVSLVGTSLTLPFYEHFFLEKIIYVLGSGGYVECLYRFCLFSLSL